MRFLRWTWLNMEGMGSPLQDCGKVKRSGLYSCRLLGDEGQSVSRAFCLPPRRLLQRAQNLVEAVRPLRFKLSLKLLQAGHNVASVDLGERMRRGLWDAATQATVEGYCLEVHPHLPLYRQWFPLSPVSTGYWKRNSQAKLRCSLGTVALVDDLVLLSAKWPLYHPRSDWVGQWFPPGPLAL